MICLPAGLLLAMMGDINKKSECDSLLERFYNEVEIAKVAVTECDGLVLMYKNQGRLLRKENEISQDMIQSLKGENTMWKLGGGLVFLGLLASLIF